MQDEEIAGGGNIPLSTITVGPICVDAAHLKVTSHGKTWSLTGLEGYFLHFLAVNANSVCTFSQMCEPLWGSNNDGDTGLLKASIRHLRQKIEPNPMSSIYILTVPDVGYMFVDGGETHSSPWKA